MVTETMRRAVHVDKFNEITGRQGLRRRGMGPGKYDEHSAFADCEYLLILLEYYMKKDNGVHVDVETSRMKYMNEDEKNFFEKHETPINVNVGNLTFEEIRVSDPENWVSLEDEATRTYHYTEMSCELCEPIALRISESGAHYIIDNGGWVHYMKPDFKSFTWVPQDDAEFHVAW